MVLFWVSSQYDFRFTTFETSKKALHFTMYDMVTYVFCPSRSQISYLLYYCFCVLFINIITFSNLFSKCLFAITYYVMYFQCEIQKSDVCVTVAVMYTRAYSLRGYWEKSGSIFLWDPLRLYLLQLETQIFSQRTLSKPIIWLMTIIPLWETSLIDDIFSKVLELDTPSSNNQNSNNQARDWVGIYC